MTDLNLDEIRARAEAWLRDSRTSEIPLVQYDEDGNALAADVLALLDRLSTLEKELEEARRGHN